MQAITSITAQPKQTFTIRLNNNESATINLYYYASQRSWYFDYQYKDYINNGNKVVLSMNLLRNVRKILPFGIGFVSTSNADPFSINSFVDGSCMMILLNKEDVQTIEDFVYNGV